MLSASSSTASQHNLQPYNYTSSSVSAKPAAVGENRKAIAGRLQKILIDLHYATLPSELYEKEFSKTYKLNEKTQQERKAIITEQQNRAKQSAINELKILHPEINVEKIDEIGGKLLDAYNKLETAIKINHESLVTQALQDIQQLDLPSVAKKCLLDVKIEKNPEEKAVIRQNSPLVIAARNRNLEVARRLFAAGANPNIMRGDFNVPVFFELTDEHHTDPSSNELKLTSYKTVKTFLELFLEHGYDINLHGNFLASFSIDKTHPNLALSIFIAINSVARLFDEKKISVESFKTFCETTSFACIFPVLIDRYLTIPFAANNINYPNPADATRRYYQLYSLILALSAFAKYEKKRLHDSYWSKEKLSKLEAIIVNLQSLQEAYFPTFEKMIEKKLPLTWSQRLDDLTTKVTRLVHELEEATTIKRFFFASTSSDEWKIFQEENKSLLTDLGLIKNNLEATPSSLMTHG